MLHSVFSRCCFVSDWFRRRFPFTVACGLVFGFLVLPVGAESGTEPPPVPPRVAELRAEIARHDDLYYRQAAPEITDYEYDLLKLELRRLEEAAGLVSTDRIGAGTTETGAARRHGAPMLSLTKVHSAEALAAWLDDLREAAGGALPALVMEPKYDGVAVSLTLHRGELRQALSRGNGEQGDDITAQVGAVRGVAYEWAFDASEPRPETIELRGEVYLSDAGFAGLNRRREAAGHEPFRHPRSVAAGAMQLDDVTEVASRGLSLVIHGWGAVHPAEATPTSMSAWRAWVRARGLPATGLQLPVEAGATNAVVETAVQTARKRIAALGVPNDGLVIKVDAMAWQARLGNGPLAPRWAVARKFTPPQGTTTLRRVVWEVGRLGTLTPVAEFDAVEIDGTQVRRASLHNPAEVRRRDLHVGDRIDVAKAGKIIPVVAEVWVDERRPEATPVALPEQCPACATAVEVLSDEAGTLRCPNFDCGEQRIRRLQHFASRRALAIRGLGPGMAETLVKDGLVAAPADLYRLREEDLVALSGVGSKTATKLLAAIAASREQPLWRLLAGVGMPGVGPQRAKAISDQVDDLAGLLLWEDTTSSSPWKDPEWRDTIQGLVDVGW